MKKGINNTSSAPNASNTSNASNAFNASNTSNTYNIPKPALRFNPIEHIVVLQIPEEKKEGLKIDAFTIQNQINAALKATVVATVRKSFSSNVVLTTTQEYSAKHLLERQNIWQQVFNGYNVISADKPNNWIKLVAHSILTKPFTDLSLLKDECSTFNPVKMTETPR